ncbi:MAG: hypothetical protein ACREFP_26565 [Acetobacteraceae bacterium]
MLPIPVMLVGPSGNAARNIRALTSTEGRKPLERAALPPFGLSVQVRRARRKPLEFHHPRHRTPLHGPGKERSVAIGPRALNRE